MLAYQKLGHSRKYYTGKYLFFFLFIHFHFRARTMKLSEKITKHYLSSHLDKHS